ncbi:Gfo/Idh/MocA family protein [Arthrobacter cryoconiti]|uniref:Gfo/Idh/MocA family oxidoreductase n=1 Tax=Arthrobacter cryoconiti TaxID=748907 RepID=A0ABV8R2Y9_9MICC|nr:Gfo/Idh/MocA family oxidoreductase [Arthrobacter cryoconiti]MCC9067910.1 Gfo/Idh/MocA family oxidoreductase [Arthrobacter cryoconiti]
MTHVIRTALLGFGLAGSVFHAPSLEFLEQFSLDVIVTGDPERQAAARAAYPGATVMDREQWQRLSMASVEEGNVDLAVIATPPATHVALAQAALEVGCAVVVDKPFTVTSAEGEALIALAKECGQVLTTYQNRRWDAEFLTLKRLLAEGALGEVRRFESRLERWQQSISKQWKAEATAADGGGILYDLGTHLVDQALQLFGDPVRVYGEAAARRPQELADDDAFIALEHAGGVISHLWMNLNAPVLGPRLRVLGSQGAYVKAIPDQQEAQIQSGILPGNPLYGVDRQENWGVLVGAGGSLPVPSERGDFTDFYVLLADAINNDAPLPVDPADSVAALRIIEQVRSQLV